MTVRFRSLLPIALLFLLTAALPVTSLAQTPPLDSSQQPVPPFGGKPEEDEQHARMTKEMAKRANQERQAELKRDTDKLLKLATELKQYVDKTNENVLSLEVLKKAEEIEKLAHNVKDKMKRSY